MALSRAAVKHPSRRSPSGGEFAPTVADPPSDKNLKYYERTLSLHQCELQLPSRRAFDRRIYDAKLLSRLDLSLLSLDEDHRHGVTD